MHYIKIMGIIQSKPHLDEVTVVLRQELDQHMKAKKTEYEQNVLTKYSEAAKRISYVGFSFGVIGLYGIWKAKNNIKRHIGVPMTILSGSFTGVVYSLFSLRDKLMLELLTLPTDQSPFAMHAREILHETIPNNPFVKRIDERLREMDSTNTSSINTWDRDNNSISKDTHVLPKLQDLPYHQEDSLHTPQEPSNSSTYDLQDMDRDVNSNNWDSFSEKPQSVFGFVRGTGRFEESKDTEVEQKATTWEEIRRRNTNN